MKKIKILLILVLLIVNIFLSNNFFHDITNVSAQGELSAKSYIVIDANGKSLFENNSEEKLPVASICKLMTTLITFEEIDKGNLSLDDRVVASSYACSVEGSQAFLDAGSEYTVRDLVKSVIVASANDSAIVLAETIGGSENEFVKLMNSKAKEIGMNNTLYANSTGLTDNNTQYSTAKDTATILNKISEYELYQEDCKIWIDKLIHPSGRETELVNTNRLIKYYPYCLTGKTGFTDEAGYCLSSTAVNDNFKLTCVVLGCDSASDRFSDSVSLYTKAYANFKSEKILDKMVPVENKIIVEKGKNKSIQVVPSQDYYMTLSKVSPESYEIKFIMNNKISAPVNIGDVVGKAQIIVNNKIVNEIDLLSNSIVEKQSLKDIIEKITDEFQFVS